MSDDRLNAPQGSAGEEPVELGPDDEFQFDCHKGVSCFNQCCMSIDATLTPYDIVRLSRRLGLSTSEFLDQYGRPFELDETGTPGVKLRPREGGTACQLVSEEGCTVYEDRPAACRYYALGNMSMRREGSAQLETAFVLVKEPHCQGHNEPKSQTVRQYRQEQGCETYDEMNREWFELLLKRRSGDPDTGQRPNVANALFYMACYDLDNFRRFVLSDKFNDILELDERTLNDIEHDDEALLKFAMRYLKQVLYGENTIPVREGARQRREVQRRDYLRHRHAAQFSEEYYASEGVPKKTD